VRLLTAGIVGDFFNPSTPTTSIFVEEAWPGRDSFDHPRTNRLADRAIERFTNSRNRVNQVPRLADRVSPATSPQHFYSDTDHTFNCPSSLIPRPLSFSVSNLSLPLSYQSLSSQLATMSFSSLVSDIAYRSSERDEVRSQLSRAKSYASTAATSVSIAGDISSQLHGGYSHPLSRAWQAERQLTKASSDCVMAHHARLLTW
jgi:hypothetical protein